MPADQKTQWPELVGQPGEEAKATIEQAGYKLVQIVQLGKQVVTMDYRQDRVRIWVDDGGKVGACPVHPMLNAVLLQGHLSSVQHC